MSLTSARGRTPSVAAAKASFSTATRLPAYGSPIHDSPSQKQTPRTSQPIATPLDGIFDKEVVPLLVESSGSACGDHLRRAVPSNMRKAPCQRAPHPRSGKQCGSWRSLHGPASGGHLRPEESTRDRLGLIRFHRPCGVPIARHHRRRAADTSFVPFPSALLGLRITPIRGEHRADRVRLYSVFPIAWSAFRMGYGYDRNSVVGEVVDNLVRESTNQHAPSAGLRIERANVRRHEFQCETLLLSRCRRSQRPNQGVRSSYQRTAAANSSRAAERVRTLRLTDQGDRARSGAWRHPKPQVWQNLTQEPRRAV